MNSEVFPKYSVKELNQAIGNLLSRGFAPRFFVNATVSKRQLKNGHLWLTLTDGQASITAVVWSSSLKKIEYQPKEDDGILVLGKLNFWETRASLVVQVIDIRPSISTVLKKFELVREILINEGLIDDARRRELPKYPASIGILTSVPSSALADILRTAKERWPLTKLFIFPIPVQGEVAKNSIIAILDKLSKYHFSFGIEAVVLARGGGSREDLVVFDNEDLCRRLSDLPVPLITGLGHEDDMTVADLVADHRSATPTAAIVDLLPSKEIAKESCVQIQQRIQESLAWIIRREKRSILERMDKFKNLSPQIIIERYKISLDQKKKILEASSPYKLLKRGFCIVTNQFGNTLKSVRQVNTEDLLQIQFTDGKIDTTVKKISINNKKPN